MVATRLLTIEEFASLSDVAGRFELIRGELREVMAAGRPHGVIGQTFNRRIDAFVARQDLGEVYISDTGFILLHGERSVIVMPDVAFVRWGRLAHADYPDGFIPFPPDLAVEIRSPSDERADVEEKIGFYREAATPLLWFCEPKPRTVTVYRPGREPIVVGEDGELDGEDVLPGFRLRLAEVFAVRTGPR